MERQPVQFRDVLRVRGAVIDRSANRIDEKQDLKVIDTRNSIHDTSTYLSSHPASYCLVDFVFPPGPRNKIEKVTFSVCARAYVCVCVYACKCVYYT